VKQLEELKYKAQGNDRRSWLKRPRFNHSNKAKYSTSELED